MVFSVTSNGWTLSTSVVSWARVLFITEWFLASIDIFFFNCNVCLGSFTWIKWIISPGCEKHLSFLHCLHPRFENYFRRLFQKGSFLSKSAIFCGVFAFWSWHKCLISFLCFLYCGFFFATVQLTISNLSFHCLKLRIPYTWALLKMFLLFLSLLISVTRKNSHYFLTRVLQGWSFTAYKFLGG